MSEWTEYYASQLYVRFFCFFCFSLQKAPSGGDEPDEKKTDFTNCKHFLKAIKKRSNYETFSCIYILFILLQSSRSRQPHAYAFAVNSCCTFPERKKIKTVAIIIRLSLWLKTYIHWLAAYHMLQCLVGFNRRLSIVSFGSFWFTFSFGTFHS